MPTGAIFGVVNMVRKLLKDYNPKQFVVVFDAPGKTFRDDWYPQYKAQRPSLPAELSCQFPVLIDLLKLMGIPVLTIAGVEADDVIGTLAVHATQALIPVIISTGDKDMMQLVTDNVTLINTMTNQRFDRSMVIEKFGVAPEQIIDYLTLTGDVVDNIQGVNQCGPKTAVKWLTTYITLDNLIANANAIKGKIGLNLRASLDHLSLSKRLVTIKTDVELPVLLEQLNLIPPDVDALIKIVSELEFKGWLKELLALKTTPIEIKPHTVITDYAELKTWAAQLTSCNLLCLNIETSGADFINATIVGISMALVEDSPIYIPIAHKDADLQLSLQDVLTILTPYFTDEKLLKIGHNLKHCYNTLQNYAITLRGIKFDTMLESYILNSSGGSSYHDLDALSLKYLGYKTISYTEVVGKGAKQISFDEVTIIKASKYATANTDAILKLQHVLYPLLHDELQSILHTIEMPLISILADMERAGVLIDKECLFAHGSRLKIQIAKLEQEALQLAGQVFNLNSPKQLQYILFEQLKLPILVKTPTGQPSTSEEVLHDLAMIYRLPAVILEYRSLSKLLSTYIEALPKRINRTTGRVHTSYNQAMTATGRLSSSDPNLQNIPIRGEEGRLIRKAFIAPPGHVILAADYSQIELRIMAHLSQDANLHLAFAASQDIHLATASEIFQIHIDNVTQEQRRRAKAINFGLIYGMSAFGLSKQLGIDRVDAQYYIDCYFKRYPGVLLYMDNVRKQAHAQGYVSTLFGRRLYLHEINAPNLMRRKAAERSAINAPVQGTAADLIKKAMIAIANWQQSDLGASSKMIMQVHDELVFEIRDADVSACALQIQTLMENIVTLAVPLKVSLGIGKNWDEAH